MTNAAGRLLLDDISLDVRAGEIMGIAGVDGNGQTELSEAVAGLMDIQAGSIELGGRTITEASVPDRQRAGMGFVPEDRLDRGLSKTMSVAENLAASNYRRAHLKRGGYVDQDRIEAFAAEKIREFDVRGAVPDTPVGTLSGGNMQKVVIARELNRDPDLLVVCQPTRGLDVGASEFIYARIMAAADRGRAVLLISSELSEIFALSDRIGVMYSGQLLRVIDRKDADEVKIGALMSGSLEAAA